jgi:hypothetical protein
MKKITVLAALGVCAVSAHAGWIIDGNPTQYNMPGTTGSYTFTIRGDFSLPDGTYNLGPLTAIPLTIPGVNVTGTHLSATTTTLISFNSGAPLYIEASGYATAPFTATVNWSVPLGTAPGSYDIAVNLGFQSTSVGGPVGSDSVGGLIILVPAPEPAQTLAGIMLVGCGGLIFAGRRLFKKQSA